MGHAETLCKDSINYQLFCGYAASGRLFGHQ